MEAALICWILVSVGCAFVLSHTAYEHEKKEFRWFLCGLVLGPFSLMFLSHLRRPQEEAEALHGSDPGFDPSHAAPATGTLDDPMSGSR